ASPRAEAAMRAHLPACEACLRWYERHLLWAQLDPRAPSAEARVARGLGLRWREPRRAYGYAFAGAVAAVVLLAWALEARPAAQLELAARGYESAPRAENFWAYRVASGAPPRLAGPTISASDELAFAYSNPAGKPYLMLFGADEHGHVYWFHPGWPVGQPALY